MTVFLATVLGWYLVLLSLFMMLRFDYAKSVIADVLSQRCLFFVLTVITLILGLLLVVSHNVWVMKWPVVVTVLAWMVLFSGLVRLFVPDVSNKIWNALSKHPSRLHVASVLNLIIGLFLLYHVYHLSFWAWLR